LESAEHDSLEGVATDETPLEAAMYSELREKWQQAIEQLPESYRDVVALRVEGLTDEQIAEALNLTLSNAQVRLHRARKRLRLLLHSVFEGTDP
jgi:RNA polymerase sigma-70 factor (ECF subfamily)